MALIFEVFALGCFVVGLLSAAAITTCSLWVDYGYPVLGDSFEEWQ